MPTNRRSLPVLGLLLLTSTASATPTENDTPVGDDTSVEACDKPQAPACYARAIHLRTAGGAKRDATKAAAILRGACNVDYALACSTLGDMFLAHEAVATRPNQNAELAAEAIYERACRLGDQRGCVKQGELLLAGVPVANVTTAAPRAIAILQRACDRGEPSGCIALGQATWDGNGVPKDPARATVLFRQACTQRAPLGCEVLGLFSAAGEMPGPTLQFLDGQCQRKNAAACWGAGAFYRKRNGSAADRAQATERYQQACHGGVVEACARLIESADANDDCTIGAPELCRKVPALGKRGAP